MSRSSDGKAAHPSGRTVHFTVAGRVQGVWFRRSTKQQADFHGITGWVRNLADGRVEGMARGDPSNLRNFRRWLERGPDMARVLKVEWTEIEDEVFEGFKVR